MSSISRRTLLKGMGALAIGALVAACQPRVAESPAVVAQPEAPEAVTAPKDKVKIELMTWGGVDRQQPRIDAFVERYPDVASWLTVEPVSPGNHDAEVYNAMRLSLAAGGEGLADLVQMNYIGVPEFAAGNLLTDVGPMMEPYGYEQDLLPGSRELATYDGKIIAIPTQVKTKIWYYRMDMFADADIDVEQVRTFEDYMEAGQKFRTKFPDSYIMNIGPQPIHYWYFMILSHWDDVRIADESGKYYLTEHPAFRTMLEWMQEWYTSGIAFNTDDWSPDWQPGFANSVIAGSPISQWMDTFLAQYAPDQKGLWGKTLWPEFNRSGSEAGGGVWVIPKGAKNPEAAFEFARLLALDTDGMVAEWRRASQLPNTKTAKDEILAQIDNYERPDDMTDEQWDVAPINFYGKGYLDAHFEAENYFRVFPYDPNASAELDLLRKHTEAFLAGQQTLDQTLAAAQRDMESQIGNPYQ